MSDKAQKISVGFDGGGSLALRVTEAGLSDLRGRLGQSSGWITLDTEDGTVSLDSSKVVYVLAAKDQTRVGFGL